MNARNSIVGMLMIALAASFWLYASSGDTATDAVAASPPASAAPTALTHSSPSLDDEVLPERQRSTDESLDSSPTETGSKLLGDKEIEASFDNGKLSVCGIPFDDLDLETWPQKRLLELNRAIRPLQIEAMRKFTNSNPTGYLFISTDEYFARKMWHTQEVLHGATRETIDADGNPQTEHGYIHVPQALSPNEYILRDAVERIYRAPAYADYLLAEGETYTKDVLAKHPDAELDFSDDLTRWVYLAPDGQVVGWTSYSRFGDN